MTTRLLAVQGPMQLIAGHLAVEWFRKIAGDVSDEPAPVLLLYDFLAPDDVEPEFVEIITEMAQVRRWHSTVFISAREMRKLMWQPYSLSKVALRKLIGFETFDEIYLARDHCGHGSPLLMNAYQDSKKITYGDSLGWVENEPIAANQFNWESPIASFLSVSKTRLRDIFLGKPKPFAFDAAVLVLPIVCSKGYLDKLPLYVPEREFVVRTVHSMYEKLIELTRLGSYCQSLTAGAKGAKCHVFLLSNLHRSGMTTIDNETQLYLDIIREHAAPGSYILLKAHPRGSNEVLESLHKQLQGKYTAFAIDDVHLSRIPIELWRGLVELCVFVPVFSASAVHLKYIYGTPVVLPLREALIRKYFFKHTIPRMLHANHIITQSVANLESWNENSILYETLYQDTWVDMSTEEEAKEPH